MSRFFWARTTLVTTLALCIASPLLAQTASNDTSAAEIRLRALEAEVRALQRQVFPGGDGKYFPPQVEPGSPPVTVTGTPASTPVSDLLARMDAVETQLARLTAQGEENGNKIAQLEARLSSAVPAATETPSAAINGTTLNNNLAAMTGGAAASRPPLAAAALAAPALATAQAPSAQAPSATKPVVTGVKPAAAVARPAKASAQRLAAVKAVVKPATNDPGDDEYSYGFRLWEAKFYPEAAQQLKMFLQKYPKHSRVSYARNLIGRAYLDEGNTEEAGKWFVLNYQANRKGERAPDSLLLLAETMRQRKDINRACIALGEFTDNFPAEAAGRLKAQYDATRSAVKCN